MPATREQAIVLITGISAAGKSTVGQMLAERLARSVHLRGDVFRRMIVGARAEMTANPSEEAERQLRLRYRLTAAACDAYFDERFTVIAQDVILGEHLATMVSLIKRRPLLVVVLAPSADVVAEREASRDKVGYAGLSVELLDRGLRHDMPHVGLWLDSSEQTPEETVEEILERGWRDGRVE
jgi:cytidylate kinase